VVWTEDLGSSQYVLVSAEPPVQISAPAGPRGRPGERFAAFQPRYRVALAVPYQDLASAWRELSLGLGAAAGIAIAVAAVAAWCLAQSIARPLRRITQAAESIAAGQLRQTIALNGSDEVVQLGHAFNRMSEEVDRSHRSLRDFVANASHELRTPLTSIEGFSQAFVDGMLDEPEDAAEAARAMNEESRRMRRLVDDLLRLSQVEGSDAPLPDEPVDAAALVRDAARRLERTAAARDLTIALDVPDTLITRGDAEQLDQVFTNLLENAGKYAPQGARITVTGRVVRRAVGPAADPPVGPAVEVAVHNTGSYIPPDDLPRVFERFYRVDPARTRGAGEVEGNGLGLAIAHGIVTRHGGTLVAASDPQTGTTFTVALPELDGASSRASASGMRPAAVHRDGLTVGA
jgi:signal transduction histidine kinase